jgi:Zn-dependent protease with chaperone function
VRLTITGWFCSALVALVVALLFAPIAFAIALLALDLINLVHPMSDPVKAAVGYFGHGARTTEAVPLWSWIEIAALLAAPGLLFMGLVIGALRRALTGSAAFTGETIEGRKPDARDLAEQRLVNVVTELSLAAALPVPAIRISPATGANGLIIGEDPAHCTLIVTRALLHCLNREALQGGIAHLIGSIADGDLAIGMRSVTHALLFDMVRRLGDGASFLASLRLLAQCALRPQRVDAAALIAQIEQWHAARQEPESSAARSGAKRGGPLYLLWAGPVVFPGQIGGLTTTFLIKPFLTLAWRRRKLMADATAVRLTACPRTRDILHSCRAASPSRCWIPCSVRFHRSTSACAHWRKSARRSSVPPGPCRRAFEC